MDMRVVGQISGPCVEHAHEANLTADESWVSCELLEGRGAGGEKEMVEILLAPKGESSQR